VEDRCRGSILGEAEAGRCHTAKSWEAGSGVGDRSSREIFRQSEAAKVCNVMRPVALMRRELLV
jgi:hypothetical protein